MAKGGGDSGQLRSAGAEGKERSTPDFGAKSDWYGTKSSFTRASHGEGTHEANKLPDLNRKTEKKRCTQRLGQWHKKKMLTCRVKSARREKRTSFAASLKPWEAAA